MAIKHRKFKMSENRRKWVENRDTTLHGDPVRMNARTAESYAAEVDKMVRKMHLDLSSQIEALFDSSLAKNSIQETTKVAMDESISSQARILTNKLVDKWSDRFRSFGKKWTDTMIRNVDKQSSKDLSRSMSKLSGGLTMDTSTISDATRDKILASADQSTSLIRSIGPNYADEVKQAVARSITDDSSSFTELKDTIHEMLQSKYKKYRNKAHNTALDQTRKAYTNITTSRMRDIGVDEYIWRHSGGSKVPRCYHRDVLNGNKYSLSDPPVIDQRTGEKGKPGDLINCKCYMEPVISFENKK